MDPELNNAIIQIRDKLQKDNIKLWKEPYFTDSESFSDENLKILAQEYSAFFKLPYERCYDAVVELQNNALSKLKQKEKFKEFGIATLKVKAVIQSNTNIFSVEISLNSSGCELKELITSHLQNHCERIKLIASGKIVKETEKLNIQGIKNGQTILAIIILNETSSDIQKSEEKFKEVESVKEDTKLLLKEDNGHYLELEDQYGNKINVPQRERKALILAMALHEKGRSSLKKNDHAKALIYFLEADDEFRQCNSQLLENVDNYALLDLDITWCYLCLQSVNHLPEAYERLNRCEERFIKSYGPNLERLIALKGTTVNETALLLRLHLLQAVVLFHQNKRIEAKALLERVQMDLKKLKVDDDKIEALIELGFSIPEARVALRANHGDLSLAANFINENRERKAEARKKALAEKILQRERKQLGKCVDGKQYVEPNFLTMLINMGYNKEVARRALQNCNNEMSSSIQYIHDNPIPGPSSSISQEMLKLINDLTPELENAGFDPRMAKMALRKYDGDIRRAIDELVENDGIIEGDFTIFEENEKQQSKKSKVDEEYEMKKVEAYDRLKEDLSAMEEDYLDLPLHEEEMFLMQYLSLLEND
ncbi:NEDD8 ultimate buster 1 isoform X2 [Agrilus planipennis]|uniref:NEDD8 ultimate buster 1 isoform X2 n=1 Tax=Agrilus planipennis TaxID=224129 RepID=A0A1W4WSC0_AGRPL|nr:NEDD8 ultimate buster 1 isoform X2 [Agrilus planipennis]